MRDEQRELDKELDKIILDMNGAYEGLSRGVKAIARKQDIHQEVIDYIMENEPTCSELLEYVCNKDPSIPKPYED